MNTRKVKIYFFYLIYLWVIFEIGFRVAFSINYKVPFFNPAKVIYNYYPELLQEIDFSKDINVLMLGASVFEDVRGDIRGKLTTLLEKEIPDKSINIINLAKSGHTSLDSRIKLDLLEGSENIDLAIFYHAINEVKANCSPDSVFQKDYSHYSKYDEISIIFRHQWCNISVIPLYLELLWLEVSGKETLEKYYKRKKKKYNWDLYGKKIKTAESFKENLEAIIEHCQSTNSELLFPEYIFHLPDDYKKSRLDSIYIRERFMIAPVEIWGIPANVKKGIIRHNEVALELSKQPGVHHVATNPTFPKERIYFNDICHLTDTGTTEFVKIVGPKLKQILVSTNK